MLLQPAYSTHMYGVEMFWVFFSFFFTFKWCRSSELRNHEVEKKKQLSHTISKFNSKNFCECRIGKKNDSKAYALWKNKKGLSLHVMHKYIEVFSMNVVWRTVRELQHAYRETSIC